MEGGEPGGLGRNTWVKQPREEDGDVPEDNLTGPRYINIGGKATVWMGKGDRLLIETPGGGAWGVSEDDPRGQDGVYKHGWAARGSLAERAAAQIGF
jgi:5-oxoprolinase (ATP-hydrolysing)